MIRYRPSLNTDPPALGDLWNEATAGRGTYPVRSPGLLERWLFSKTYFRRDDITVAIDHDTGQIVGFALAGFAPREDMSTLDPARGVVCAVVVRPSHRRQGIGRELLRLSEHNLRERGAGSVTVGAQWPDAPYLFGLYGGSNAPGILASEADASAFLARLGYHPTRAVQVFHKKLDTPLTVADPRFGTLRRRYDCQTLRLAGIATWWHECVWGSLEPVEMRLTDKLTGIPAARAVVWELEGFSWKWNHPSAGILDVQVRSDLRHQGVGKLLVSQVLRFLQDQFFALAELQVPADDPAAVGLCRSLGFDEVDRGETYRYDPPEAGTAVTVVRPIEVEE